MKIPIAVSNLILQISLSIILFTSRSYADTTRASLNKPCEMNLSREEFRAYALKNSPIVKEIDQSYSEEISKAIETEALINPELQVEKTFTGMDVGGANDSQSQVFIGQPIRISDFGSRDRVSALFRKSGDVKHKTELLRLLQKLSLQYQSLYTYQRMAEFLRSSEAQTVEKVQRIREGVLKGLLSAGDELLFEGEQFRLEAQLKGIEATIASLQAELSRSAGTTCLILATEPLKGGKIPTETELYDLASKSELGEEARLSLYDDLTKAQLQLAEHDSFGSITPKIIYQHTNDGGDFYGAGFSMPIPFWNQNKADIGRVSAEREVVLARRAMFANGGLRHQLSSLRMAIASREEQLRLYSTKVIPAFDGALRSLEKQFSEGKGSVLQVWQSLRTLNEVKTQALMLELDVATSRVELFTLVGGEI